MQIKIDPQHIPTAQSQIAMYYHDESGIPKWTGWAWLGQNALHKLKPQANKSQFEEYLQNATDSNSIMHQTGAVLSIESVADILAANRIALDGQVPGLMLTGSQVQQRVWLSRNVSIHPSVRVLPPVYIGTNCRIAELPRAYSWAQT